MKTLIATATLSQAIPTVDSITGDANTLHAEFSFPFNEGLSLAGSWAGGTYILNGFVGVVHTGFQLEMYQRFELRTFWNDGWVPGSLGTLIVGTTPAHNFPLTTFDLSEPFPAFIGNGLQYYLSASAFIDLTLVPETRSGHGIISYDIARMPVTDAGSTLTLLGLTLTLIGAMRMKETR